MAKKKKKKPQPEKKSALRWLWVIVALALFAAAFLMLHKKPKARIAEITFRDYGTVTVALDAKNAPKTVAQFVKLAEEGFYDGTVIHRAIPNLLIQGGAPRDGESAPYVKGEFKENGVNNERSHVRGTISLARATPYDSGSSQFFIVCRDYPDWDGSYAAFGEVTDGMEIVDAIANREIYTSDEMGFLPEEAQVVIERVVMKDAD